MKRYGIYVWVDQRDRGSLDVCLYVWVDQRDRGSLDALEI